MLEVQGLNVSYGDSQVLRGVHLNIPAGKVVCLMGRNGVGKTTLMKTIIGLLAPKGGRITLAGEEITKAPPYLRARRGIGYVPQGREIIPSLTVEENLLIGLEASGGKTIPAEVFDLFPVLKTMLGRRGGDLSGGQQQQLAIGRALVSGPRLLLLDEPTEGIQPSIIKEIVAVIRRIKGDGKMAILLVEQYLSLVREVADSFYVMEKGAIAAEGPVEKLTDEVVRRHLTV
ncbi:MAG: urea ABC transporter ATP-binding subunit UrtE [Candidatus Manganitrophus sp. SB1]|nr:urea ABC transporter ATP-binding subunit UrtE [Candidatus Manganitrophus morganii]